MFLNTTGDGNVSFHAYREDYIKKEGFGKCKQRKRQKQQHKTSKSNIKMLHLQSELESVAASTGGSSIERREINNYLISFYITHLCQAGNMEQSTLLAHDSREPTWKNPKAEQVSAKWESGHFCFVVAWCSKTEACYLIIGNPRRQSEHAFFVFSLKIITY